MFKLAKQHFTLLRGSARHILLFELAYKLVATCIAYPLVILIINLSMKIAGISYLTNEYILKAVVNPVFIILMLLTILAFVLYCAYEMSFLSACFEFERRGCEAGMIETAYTTLHRMKRLFYPNNILLNLYYFISILVINVTIIGNLLYSQTIVNLFHIYVVNNHLMVKLGIIAVLLVLYFAVIYGVFAFHIFTVERTTFKKAYQKSSQIVRKHFIGTNVALIGYNILILALIGAFYVLISVILIAGVKLLDLAYLGSAIYLSILKYMRTGTKIFLVYVAIPLSYNVISRLYYKYSDCSDVEYEVMPIAKDHYPTYRKIYFALLSVAILLNVVYITLSFNKNPFDKVAIFHETKISAHRGSSIEAPENTLAAFSKAMEDMSDYIELDVRQTKDGQIVVMHDSNAKRTTGVDQYISDMTLEEVKQLNAAYAFGDGNSFEEVPTLEEVMKLVDKKCKINIEIKTNDKDTNMAEAVTDIIHKYNAVNDCVVTSFDYKVLLEIKQHDPNLQVGYILSVAYGDFYNMDDVDFFSMNASFLSKRVVDAIHNSGKQVYAWTVNNETSIRNLTNKGVDNIITDNPVLARETVYSRDTSESLRNMIKYVFNG